MGTGRHTLVFNLGKARGATLPLGSRSKSRVQTIIISDELTKTRDTLKHAEASSQSMRPPPRLQLFCDFLLFPPTRSLPFQQFDIFPADNRTHFFVAPKSQAFDLPRNLTNFFAPTNFPKRSTFLTRHGQSTCRICFPSARRALFLREKCVN